MKKLTLLLLLNSFMYSQNCHEPSGWCFDVTTFQCFYMFQTILIKKLNNISEQFDFLQNSQRRNP